MPATTDAHPEKDQLVAFGLGKLDPAEASQIEQHLEACQDCCSTILNLQDDTFVGLVRVCQPASAAPDQSGVTLAVPAGSGEAQFAAAELPAALKAHDRYEIQELIGRGGMGDVYKAQHKLMSRQVALKVIKPQLVRNEAAVQRFRREVQAAASLHHKHIVTAYDAEQAGELHFLVMEFVAGVNLDEVIRQRGPLPVAEACNYIRQAAEGLQHAHELGMVHRDIKPHNLMVTKSGEVKILDFGLAGFATEVAEEEIRADNTQSGIETAAALHQLTQMGTMMGTPDYIAPEQAVNAHSADIRADIYSLGCTLYTLLAGAAPFSAGTVLDKIKAHAEQAPRALSELRSDVSPEVEAVVQRMMAKDPLDRYQTPQDVVDALTKLIDARIDDRLRRHGIGEPPMPPKPRTVGDSDDRSNNFAKLVGLALLTVAIVVGIIAGTWEAIHLATDTGRLEIRNDGLEINGARIVLLKNGKEYASFDVEPGTRRQTIRAGEYEVALRGAPPGVELHVWSTKKGQPHDFGAPTNPQDKVYTVYRGGGMGIEVSRRQAIAMPLEGNVALESILDWTPLFNGRDLTGWKVQPDKPGNWRVENGVLIGGKLDSGSEDENSFLVTEKNDYTNFHLKLEAKLNPGAADAGVLFDFADGSWAEANIAFNPANRDQFVGSLIVAGTKPNGKAWQAAPTDLASPDQWFTLEVIAVGRQITTKVNGKIAATHTQRKKTTGPIRLQDHGPFTVAEFRKIEITELDEHGNPLHQPTWTPLFNGRDLAGWKPHPDLPGNWHVDNGVLIGNDARLKIDTNTFLMTDRNDYKNFHLRLEARVRSASADSGVNIDYTGKWDHFTDVNITFDPKKLGRQTGSIKVYGSDEDWIKTPVGMGSPNEWFTLEVIARDSHIIAKVNGRVASESLKRKLGSQGHILLQQRGGQTAVEFRKIEIIELDEYGKPLRQQTSSEAPPLTIGMNDEFGMLFEGRLVAPAELSRVLREALKENPERVVAIDLPKRPWTVAPHVDQLEQIARIAGAKRITRPAWAESAPPQRDDQSIKELHRLKSHTGSIERLAFIDNTRFVSAGLTGEEYIWDARQGKRLQTLTEPDRLLTAVAAAPAAGLFATGNSHGQIRLWNKDLTTTGTMKGHEAILQTLAMSADGSLLMSSGVSFVQDPALLAKDLMPRIWNTKTQELVRMLDSKSGLIVAAAFTPDGKRLVTGGMAKHLNVWNVATGELLSTIELGMEVRTLSLSPDGRLAAVASSDPVVIVDLQTKEVTHRLNGHTLRVQSVAFLPDGRHVVSGSQDKTWRVWSLAESREVAQVTGTTPHTHTLAVSPDGKLVAGGGGEPYDQTAKSFPKDGDYDLRVWELPESLWPIESASADRIVVEISVDGQFRLEGRPLSPLELSNRLKAILKEDPEREVHVIPAERFRGASFQALLGIIVRNAGAKNVTWPEGLAEAIILLRELRGSKEWITDVAYPENDRAITVAVDGVVRVWKNFGAELESHQLPFGGQADISPDGRLVVVASASNDKDIATVALWELDGWKERWKIEVPTTTTKFTPKYLVDVRFAPHDRVLVRSNVDSGVAIVDAADGRVLSRYPEKGPATGVASISPDGKRIFVRQMAPAPLGRIYRLEDGAELAQVDTRDVVPDAIWSRDGTKLILAESTLNEGRIAVFEASTGKLVRRWVAESKGIESLALGQGNLLATGGLTRIAVWDWSTGKLLAAVDSPKQDGDARLAIAISPDGKRLISGGARWLDGDDRLPRIWQLPESVGSQPPRNGSAPAQPSQYFQRLAGEPLEAAVRERVGGGVGKRITSERIPQPPARIRYEAQIDGVGSKIIDDVFVDLRDVVMRGTDAKEVHHGEQGIALRLLRYTTPTNNGEVRVTLISRELGGQPADESTKWLLKIEAAEWAKGKSQATPAVVRVEGSGEQMKLTLDGAPLSREELLARLDALATGDPGFQVHVEGDVAPVTKDVMDLMKDIGATAVGEQNVKFPSEVTRRVMDDALQRGKAMAAARSKSGAGQATPGSSLTEEQIKELVSAAAGIPNEDWTKLASGTEAPSPDTLESQTLSLMLFSLRALPPAGIESELPAIANLKKDFQYLPEHTPKPAEIAKALWISRTKGYASYIQPEYVTEVTVNVTGDTASGEVAFEKEDLYRGRVRYVARRAGGDWRIEEFHLPNVGLSLQLSEPGVWKRLVQAQTSDNSP